MAGSATGNTSFTPVPGNILLNPSFEEGVLFDHWSVSGGYGGTVNGGGGADGRSWPVLSTSTIIWQDVPTVPGHQYRVRFIWGAGSGRSGLCRVLWDSNEVGRAAISIEESVSYQCPTFFAVASNTTTRFMLQNLGTNAFFDGCSVLDNSAPPAIVTQPSSISTLGGGTAAFVVGVVGSEPISYQWYFNGTAISNGTERVLVRHAASVLDAGDYHVAVQNAFGAVTSAIAKLIVESPTYPIIVWQPHSETVTSGDYVALSAVAAGTPPLRYQWYLDNDPVTDATNGALIFDPVQATNAGTYRVRVDNDAGIVWSLAATLAVTPTNAAGARIHFTNRATPSTLSNDAPVLDIDAFTRLNGSNFIAQLYAGAVLAELRPVGKPRVFYSGYSAGFFEPVFITLPNTAPGSNVFAQVRVWERSYGTTYEEARALGGKFGKSEILYVSTRPAPWPPAGLEGLQSFSLQAGLPYFSAGIIHLLRREPQGVAVWSLEGEPNARYVIEKAVQDLVWQPYLVLTNITGTVTFSDSANGDAHVVLFRARRLD